MSDTSESQDRTVRLRKRFREGAIHPWVYRRTIKQLSAGLRDGDEVILRGYCERDGFARIGFGECRGTVLPAE